VWRCGGERTPAIVTAALPPAGVDHQIPQEIDEHIGAFSLHRFRGK